MKIPQQYLPVMPYLILKNSKAFYEFAKSVFGAAEQYMARGENDQIMHGEIKIHDAVIMFAEASEAWKEKPAGMFIYVKKVDRIYQTALNKGAKDLMKPQQQGYGYTAGFEDPFGNQWWIVEAEKE